MKILPLPWAKRLWGGGGGGGIFLFGLPCQLFFLLRFFFVFTQNKGSGAGRPGPSSRSATALRYSPANCTSELDLQFTKEIFTLVVWVAHLGLLWEKRGGRGEKVTFLALTQRGARIFRLSFITSTRSAIFRYDRTKENCQLNQCWLSLTRCKFSSGFVFV